MAIRQGHELLELLGSRLGECDAVDIAVASTGLISTAWKQPNAP